VEKKRRLGRRGWNLFQRKPSFLQDGFDTSVMEVAKEEGSLSGSFHRELTMFLCESQKGLGLAKVSHGMLTQNLSDQGFRMRTNLRSFFTAVTGSGHEISEFLGWIVREVSDPCTDSLCSNVSFDQLLIKEDLNQPPCSSYPDFFANPSRRNGVIGLIKNNVMIGMNPTLLPLGTFERLRRQSSEPWHLLLLEDFKGLPLGRTMDLHPYLFFRPTKGPLVGFINISKGSPCQKVFSHNRYSSFHLPFMPWLSRFGWIRYKSIMPFQFPIGSIQCGIVEICFRHSRFQIIQHHGSRDTPKEFKGPNMTINPVANIGTKEESNEPVSTKREGHDKGPGSPKLPCCWI
jgi:hypothetical protein